MTIEAGSIEAELNGGAHEDFQAMDRNKDGARPAVIIAHPWTGRCAVEGGDDRTTMLDCASAQASALWLIRPRPPSLLFIF